jgi:hypothetical protein
MRLNEEYNPMFTLTQISARSRRLGLGIAIAALTLATAASPMSAFAAQSGPDDMLLAPAPTSDLQVIAKGKTQIGRMTQFHFVIRNNGPAGLANFNAYKEAQLQQVGGPGFDLVDDGYFTMSLASGQEKPVTVTCVAGAGWKCKQASALTLSNPTDPNNANNMQTIFNP